MAEVADLEEGVTPGKFTWSSSDESIVSCRNGAVSGKNAGTAVVTCSVVLSDGTELSASCPVTVIVPVQSVSVKDRNITLTVSETIKPVVEIRPQDATNHAVVFSSSDESILKADAEGMLTAVAPGKAKVTVTAADGSGKTTTVAVEVKPRIGTDDVIAFLGIPWRSSVETVRQMLIDGGFIREEYSNDSLGVFIEPDSFLRGSYLKTNKQLIASQFTPASQGYTRCTRILYIYDYQFAEGKTIGGYPIDGFLFTFAFDGNKTELVTVTVFLKAENLTAAYKDIEEKLNSLYGQCLSGSSRKFTSRVWKGLSGSVAMLFTSGSTSELYIYYGLLDPADIFDAAGRRYDQRTNDVSSDDTGGL